VRALLASLTLIVAVTACGSDTNSTGSGSQDETADTGTDTTTTTVDEDSQELYPDVLDVSAEQSGDGSWTFSVTLSSPYDSPERYADAWRVVGPDGEVYGERILLHDHADEQPFTRSQSGIAIPDGITEVTVEGRDQISGWGGQTVSFALPG
jgi:hypothetical protein